MKIATVLGTRPEITKLSPLIPLLEGEFDHFIVHTGQHYDHNMDDVFFQQLHLPEPKHHLAVGSHAQGKQTALILEKLEQVFLLEKPDMVVVLGDTNTAPAAALAAAKLHIPLVHIESGCRSFNRKMPEEINRIVADHLASICIAPDDASVRNLQQEGIIHHVHNTGSTMFDAVTRNLQFAPVNETLAQYGLKPVQFVIATIHRAENTNDGLRFREIMDALNSLAGRITVVFPIHPRTRNVLEEQQIALHPNIKVIEPQPYLSFLALLSQCRFIISDSGGIQEEALAVNKPCIIPREETEWTRLVEAGKNFLAGTRKEKIIATAERLLDDRELQKIKEIPYSVHQDVSRKIVEVLKKYDSPQC